MSDYIVQPFAGVGPVRLGMSRDDVLSAMSEPSVPFRKGPTSRYETDSFHGSGFQVFYGGDQPVVEYIELWYGLPFRVLYRELPVFATPADEVVAFISRHTAYDETNSEIPYSYIFPSLQLSLWREVVPESESDTEGRYFSTIGIGRKGYYDDVA